ncbi:UNVERIFIED_CONTAM: hypothetical protein Sindi_2877800, partial [Sesamum indicum]
MSMKFQWVNWQDGQQTELTHGDRNMKALEALSVWLESSALMPEYVARTVSSKKRILPLSACDRDFSYAPGDAFTPYKLVATV